MAVFYMEQRKQRAAAIKVLRGLIDALERGASIVALSKETGIETTTLDWVEPVHYLTGRHRLVIEWSTIGMRPAKKPPVRQE